MKIHESMNVLLHKKLTSFLLLAFLLAGFGSLHAQAPGLDIYQVTLLKNTSHSHSFQHFHAVFKPNVEKQAVYGTADFVDPVTGQSLGDKGLKGWNQENIIRYTPPTGFVGRDSIEISFWNNPSAGNPKKAYKVFHFLVVPSYLYAENDYVTTQTGTTVVVNALDNDFGNGTNLVVSEITNVNHGTADKVNGGTQIEFTPAGGFSGLAHLNYTICDAQGSCDMATVTVKVLDPSPPQYDYLFVTTNKNSEQVVLMDLDSNYVISSAPTNGTIDTFETLTYTPNTNFVGYDTVVFENTVQNRTREFEIRVLDVPDPNLFLYDDVVFTPIDEVLEEIHLLKNDLGGSYLTSVGVTSLTTEKEGQLVYLPAVGKGVYRYIPPQGFTGIDWFEYRARPPQGGDYEYATCYIVVSNLDPERPVFQLTTAKNTPLALGDHLPFLNYEYEVISQGDKGTATFHAGKKTVTSQHGQTFTGTNMLVYDPDPDELGLDEFEVEYCIGGQSGNCPLVKIEVIIADILTPQSDTLCAGSTCVWTGDANHDGKVDINDILPIGLCMGEVGKVRQGASMDWYAQYSDDWKSLYADGLPFDVKHVDTDGNAIVSAMDTTAIREFYGNYSNLFPQPHSPISSLPFYIDTDPLLNIQPGDVVYAPVHLGNDTVPALDAYGLTFNIEYDPALFESVKVYWSDTSWMEYNSPILSMTHEPVTGKLDAGYTRTSGLAASGYGKIGVVEFIVIDDVAGFRLNRTTSEVKINGGGLMNGSGQVFDLENSILTFALDLDNEEAEEETTTIEVGELHVFPNPVDQLVTVHLNGPQEIEEVAIYNLVGEQVYQSGTILTKRTQVDVSGLAPGMYVVKVWSGEEVITSKIEVIR